MNKIDTLAEALEVGLGPLSVKITKNYRVYDSLGRDLLVPLMLESAGDRPVMVFDRPAKAGFFFCDGAGTPEVVDSLAEYCEFLDVDARVIVHSGVLADPTRMRADELRIEILASEDAATWTLPVERDLVWIDSAVEIGLQQVFFVDGRWKHTVNLSESIIVGHDGTEHEFGCYLMAFAIGGEDALLGDISGNANALPAPKPGRSVRTLSLLKISGLDLAIRLPGESPRQIEKMDLIISVTRTAVDRDSVAPQGLTLRCTNRLVGSDGPTTAPISIAGAPTSINGGAIDFIAKMVQQVEQNFGECDSSPAEVIASRFDQLLVEFQGLDPCKPDAVQEVFLGLVGRIGIPLPSISRPAPMEQWYFRARLLFDNHEELRGDPSQFGAPPAKFTKLGRANLSGHPVFYGADDVETAIGETTSEDTATLFLSTWRSGSYRPSYVFTIATEGGKTTKLRNQRSELLGTVEQRFKAAPDSVVGASMAALEGMGRVFVEDTGYALSSLIAHHYLYDSDFDGIEYPDAKRQLGLNYALGPKMLDKLILHRVFLVHRNGDKFSISGIGVPTDSGKKLEWRQFNPDTDDFPAPKEFFSEAMSPPADDALR